jgi:aldehyde dehydrogenase family 9 protein A1
MTSTPIIFKEKVFTSPLMFVDGKRVVPTGTEKLQIVTPATGKVQATSPVSSVKDVDMAVQAAKKAFPEWSKMTGVQRGKLLCKAAFKIREHIDEIAWIEVADTGKPIWEAKSDVECCADVLEYYAGLAPTVVGEHIPMPNESHVYTRREALGVCAGIGAFNFPFQMAILKSAAALACGNTMVFKPSPLTPLSCITLAEIYKFAGIPDGVFNVIQGNVESSQALINHPLIAKVSFTGSVPTGTKIYEAAAKDMKQVTLELGGKSPLIIFEDACLENAVKGAMLGNFLNQGQVCSNGTRVFVHKSMVDKFAKAVAERVAKLKIGNPNEADTMVGATISPEQAQRVLGYIETARKEGANFVCGGDRVEMPEPFNGGFYIRPCVLTNCKDEMTVCKEEVFGPVMAILPFETEEEVIKRANNTEYGLAAGVFTKDLQRAHRVAAKIEAGVVYINTYNAFPPELPFGGVKKSGMGREAGMASLHFWTQTKAVYVEGGDVDAPY